MNQKIKLRQDDISVLVYEQDTKRWQRIREILDYVGLSGQRLCDFARTEKQLKTLLQTKSYYFVLGDLPSYLRLKHQYHVRLPPELYGERCVDFKRNLSQILEKEFDVLGWN